MMVTSPLPQFRYYEDPLGTESFVVSDVRCLCCGECRGYIYTGPVYSFESYSDCFCPWCIADGSAHRKFDVEFNTAYALKTAPQAVIDEILFRTPGFPCWEQGDWQEHCGDAALYLGVPGKNELDQLPAAVLSRVRQSTGVDDDELWAEMLDIAGDVTGIYQIHLFRCLTCHEVQGFLAAE